MNLHAPPNPKPATDSPLAGRRLSRLRQVALNYPLTAFVVLAYSCSWLLFAPMIIEGGVIPALIVAASFGPSVAAVSVHWLATGGFRAFRFASSWPRVLLGSTLGFALVVLTFVALPAIIAADARQLRWSVLVSLGVYNLSTLLGGPLGEEPGWRGYALPRLEERFGPTGGSLLVGILWVGWHLPLFLVPGWTSSSLWTYTVLMCGLSVIMTFSFNLGRFSLVAAIATHAAFNTVSKFLAGLLKGVELRIEVPFVALMALSAFVISLGLIVATKGRLAYSQSAEPVENSEGKAADLHHRTANQP
jgi:membrane protease YdiL (CAAX protease family)